MCDSDIMLATGLEFFSKVSASVSHEIKNALAIIRENAGLMEDLMIMAEKGMPLNLERLKALAVRINKQTERADVIVGNLNRFAHSVDEPLANVEVGEVLHLVEMLSLRPASMECIELRTKDTGEAISVETAPFFLANLVWLCLQSAITTQGKQGCIELEVSREDAGARIALKGIDAGEEACPPSLNGRSELALQAHLGAKVSVDEKTRVIVMQIPKRRSHAR